MARIHRVLGLFLGVACAASAAAGPASTAPTSDAADTWFGQRFEDPFRPLEDLKSPATERWFRSQARQAEAALARIPGRDALVKEWLAIDARTPPRYSDFTVENGRVFYRKTLAGEPVGKLFVREGWQGAERLLLDPLKYVPDEHYALGGFSASPDGARVVVRLAKEGAEWGELRVLDVASGRMLDDKVAPVWFDPSWSPDGTAFFYNGKPGVDPKDAHAEEDTQLLVHRVGTPASEDRDLMSRASTPGLGIDVKELPFAIGMESDPSHVYALAANVQTELKLYASTAAAVAAGRPDWKPVSAPSDGLVRGVAVYKGWIYAATYRDAPRYALVRTRLESPDWSHAEVVLPQAADSLVAFTQSRSHLLLEYSDGLRDRLIDLDLDAGTSRVIALPVSGTQVPLCPDSQSNHCLAVATGWIVPTTLYDVDLDSGAVARSAFSGDAKYPEFDGLVVDEVEVPSHDGVMVPLSIIHRKDLKLDGSSPCILEGYGAYGISYNPAFDVRLSVANHGVVFAYAHVRGGSEKGEAWYRAGFKGTKPNTWKDFIAAGEWLVQKGYTGKDRLTGRGTSAGGILISRAITERPDLFRAAVVNVGDANMLRSEFSPNGPPNIPEFGTVKDKQELAWLAEMDGLSHVRPGVHYPAVLGVGGWNDARVPVWEPGKFVAAVQWATGSGLPVMMMVNFDNGHFTEDKKVTFRNFANQYAFPLWQAGLAGFQPEAAKAARKQPATP